MKKIYSLFLGCLLLAPVSFAQDVKVLVMVKDDVADSALAGVKSSVDAIKSIPDINFTFDYLVRSDIEGFSDFESYDLAFMTENPGSGQAQAWGVNGIKQLPTLCYKSYALLVTKEGWPWINDNDANNWYVPETVSNTDATSESEIEILADHFILTDMDIAVGGKFSMGSAVNTDFVGKAKYQTYNITHTTIAANAVAVGKSTHAEANGAPVSNILYAIEENDSSKRCVVLGTHQGFLENTTSEMDKLTTGAIKWLLMMDTIQTTTGTNKIRLSELGTEVYPNPASGIVTAKFHVDKSTDVKIELINSLGEIVGAYNDFYSTGIFEKQINISELVTGLYFIKVQTNGKETVQKFLVK